MNNSTIDLIKALAQKQNIEEVFRAHLENIINQLLKHELIYFLDYEPYEHKGIHLGNYQNGYYDCPLKTEYVEVFRETVMENWNSGPLAYYKPYNDTLEQFIIHMYQ